MTFDEAPSYKDRATLMPIEVRRRPVTVQAMFFSGLSIEAARIVDWVRLSGRSAEYVSTPSRSPKEHRPFIALHGPEGAFHVFPHWWVILGVEGEFYAVTDNKFSQSYDFI